MLIDGTLERRELADKLSVLVDDDSLLLLGSALLLALALALELARHFGLQMQALIALLVVLAAAAARIVFNGRATTHARRHGTQVGNK